MPITPEQMSAWIAKTWKQCQDQAWGEKSFKEWSDEYVAANIHKLKGKEQE